MQLWLWKAQCTNQFLLFSVRTKHIQQNIARILWENYVKRKDPVNVERHLEGFDEYWTPTAKLKIDSIILIICPMILSKIPHGQKIS